jgi:tetratricopeptide (TPR) repeat protein
MNENSYYNIFISYGRQPKKHVDLVERIKLDLEKNGFKIWIDKENLKSKEDWEIIIEEAIKSNDQIIYMMTDYSTRRPDGYCLNELSYALINKKSIIPVMIEMVTPPLSICRLQWVDMLNIYKENDEIDQNKYQVALDQILISIKNTKVISEINVQKKSLVEKLSPQNFDYDITQHTINFTGREWFFDKIQNWMTNHSSSVLWLIAEPGFGKTAICANATFKIENVCGIFFCQYNSYMRSNVIQFIKTFAFHLSSQIFEYKTIIDKFEIEDINRWSKDSKDLFQKLIIEPLNKINSFYENHLYIIDALDEIIKDNDDILKLIANEFNKLPLWIKIFITSRSNQEIEIKLSNLNPIYIHNNSQENLSDLNAFVKRNISDILDKDINKLIDKSEGNILYLKSIYDEIKLNRISLENIESFPLGLNNIYHSYFQRQFENYNEYKRFHRPLFELMVTLKEPITKELIISMLNWNEYEYNDTLDTLISLIKESERGIEFYHKSFIDWLTDIKKSGKNYFISEKEGLNRLIRNENWIRKVSYGALIELLPKVGPSMTFDFSILFIDIFNSYGFTDDFYNFVDEDLPILNVVYNLTDKQYILKLFREFIDDSISKGLFILEQNQISWQERMNALSLIFGSLFSITKINDEELMINMISSFFEDINTFIEYIDIQEALEHYPKGILFDLGQLCYDYKNYISAVKLYQLALEYENNGDEFFVHSMLGICYMELAEKSSSDDISNEKKAIFHYNKALELFPEKEVKEGLLFDLGIAYMYSNDYDNAISTFMKVIELNPNKDDAFIRLGSLFSVKNNKEEALKYTLRAIELNKYEPDYHYTLGQIYGSLGQTLNSINAYKKTIELNNEYYQAFCNLSDVYNRLGEFQIAKEYASRAMEINPEDEFSICTLAESCEKLNDINKAKELYEKVLHIDSNFQDAINGLNRVLIKE